MIRKKEMYGALKNWLDSIEKLLKLGHMFLKIWLQINSHELHTHMLTTALCTHSGPDMKISVDHNQYIYKN